VRLTIDTSGSKPLDGAAGNQHCARRSPASDRAPKRKQSDDRHGDPSPTKDIGKLAEQGLHRGSVR